MKVVYNIPLVVLLWGLSLSSLMAQEPIYIGRASEVALSYRAKASSKDKIVHEVSGKHILRLEINSSRKEEEVELFYGKVEATENSDVYLKIKGNEVIGTIILRDQKRYFEYSSSTDGKVYILEKDIDKVICVGYEKNPYSSSSSLESVSRGAAAVPVLESLPGAGAVVYLDFNGQTVSGTLWNSSYNSGNPIVADPANLTEAEMVEVWRLMSEDFRPFALNITTNEAVFNSVPANRRMRVIFTPTNYFYPGAGGAAYIGSFTFGGTSYGETPAFVWNTTSKYAGEAGSHEVGHTLYLGHDGRLSPAEEYYQGQGSWAPIMGVGYYVSMVQWSKGEYLSASNTEDDLNTITTRNGFGYRPDDHSNTSSGATALISDAAGNISSSLNKGVMTLRGDVDVFSFTTRAGTVSFTVNPFAVNPNATYANLDVSLILKNASNTTIAMSDPSGTSASLTQSLAEGTYYIFVDGARGTLGADSDYGSIGEYSISGKIIKGSNPTVSITSPTNGSIFTAPATIPIAATASDADGSVVKVEFFNGSTKLGEDLTAPYNYTWSGVVAGVYNITAKATDNVGWTSTSAAISVTVQNSSTSQWNVRFGGSGTENFSQVIHTPDGGYLLGGSSSSPISGDKTQSSRGEHDFWLVKTDAVGNKQWDRRFGGSLSDQLYTIIQTSDGGYLLGGRSYSGASGDRSQGNWGGPDYWIVKISSTGTKQWDKRYGGTGFDDLRKVVQLSSGEYMLAGYSDSPISGDKTQSSRGGLDYWVIKISSTGAKIWDKRFGGTSTDFLATMLPVADGFLLGGESASGASGDKTQGTRGAKDYWVVKINSSGTKVWDKRFGGSADDFLNSLSTTADGNYLLSGTSLSSLSGDRTQSSRGGEDYWVVKINSSGTKVWDKRFGGSANDDLESGILTTVDGGFLLGGYSASGASGDRTQSSRGGEDYWMVKINSSGTKVWDKRFGGSAADQLISVLQAADGGYVLGGHSASGAGGDKTQGTRGANDYWLVKISPTGATSPEAIAAVSEDPLLGTSPTEQDPGLGIEAYPNPFSEKITVNIFFREAQQVNLAVYDMVGREVATLYEGQLSADTNYQFEWKPSEQQKIGIYLIRLQAPNYTGSKKILFDK